MSLPLKSFFHQLTVNGQIGDPGLHARYLVVSSMRGTITRNRHISTKAKHGGVKCEGSNYENRRCPHAACETHKGLCLPEDGEPLSSKRWITFCPGKICAMIA